MKIKKPKFKIWKLVLIIALILVGTVLFGSVVAQWGGIIMGWISTFFGWISTALSWLAKVLNFFGWNGMV